MRVIINELRGLLADKFLGWAMRVAPTAEQPEIARMVAPHFARRIAKYERMLKRNHLS